MRFEATIELSGKSATGIQVPDHVVAKLGPAGRPAVVVTIGDHSYRTTVARMGGRYLVPLSAENRQAAGVAAGEQIQVDITLDTAVRTVEIPPDLAAALDPPARAYFDALAFSHRKEWVRWIEDAKRPETRTNRVATAATRLREGRPTR
jgi:hypothetical protein